MADDRDDSGPAPAPVAAPGPGDASSSGDALGWLPDWMLASVPYWLTTRETVLGSILGAAGLVVCVFVVAGATTCWDARSLSDSLTYVETVRADDTYGSWTTAYEVAERNAVPPGSLRRFLHTLGAVAPVNPAARRHQLQGELAYIAAQIEYRFESENSRRAFDHARTAFGPDRTNSPTAAAAQTYRLLSRGDIGEALSVARSAREEFEGNRRVDRAFLEAALAAGAAEEIVTGTEQLKTNAENWTARDRYLLARSATYDPDFSRDEALQSLLDREGAPHLGAKIEMISELAEREKPDEAETQTRSLLDDDGDSAAPYQLARIHIALGRALAASAGGPSEKNGDEEKDGGKSEDGGGEASSGDTARTQFEKAIETIPERTSVYVPLIDYFLDAGDLEAAAGEIEAAESTAGTSELLDVRKARLAYLQGRFDEALQLLATADDNLSLAPILEGRIRLATGDAERAKAILDEVPDAHPEYDTARLLGLVAQADIDAGVPESARKTADEVTAGEALSAQTYRAAARLSLRAARYEEGEVADAALDSTAEFIDAARERQPDRALHDYLSCERYRLEEDREQAAHHCRRAREKNPAYLPGMMTAVRVEMLRQSPEDAALLAARLAGTFDDSWAVAKLQMRALLRSHRPDRARTVLARWRDREDVDPAERRLFDGHIAFFQGDYDAALESYGKARDSGTVGEEASLYYAHSLVRLDRPDDAEKIVRGLTDTDRWRAAAWTVFGELRRRQGRGRDALENLSLARRHLDAETDPRWRISQMQTQRALTWRDRRDWDDGRVGRYLERARERGDPESPETLYPFGLYYLYVEDRDRNDPEKAAEYLQKVVDIQPHRCGAIDALVEAYDESGDWRGKRDAEELYAENCE